jgi:hypothetical protein
MTCNRSRCWRNTIDVIDWRGNDRCESYTSCQCNSNDASKELIVARKEAVDEAGWDAVKNEIPQKNADLLCRKARDEEADRNAKRTHWCERRRNHLQEQTSERVVEGEAFMSCGRYHILGELQVGDSLLLVGLFVEVINNAGEHSSLGSKHSRIRGAVRGGDNDV